MSSAPLRVFLNREQERTLWELRAGENIPQRTKDRAEAVRLSAQGWKIEKIAIYLKWMPNTVRLTLHRWQEKGLGGLWDQRRPGRNRKWSESDIACVEEKLEAEQRTYNCRQYCLFMSDYFILKGMAFSHLVYRSNVKGKQHHDVEYRIY